jgi:mRNA-degrading endonuclease RelE of RelBE toxin-antitoxin system
MSYRIIATDHFKKEAKKLSKKYHSLKADLELLGNELADNPTSGVSLGHNLYKVRLAIASKSKGKSGGARVITLVKKVKGKVYLISIYDKAKFDNLSKHHIAELLEKAGLK